MLKHLKTLSGHQNPVYALANSDKEGIFFSAGNDKGVVEWSAKKMAFVMVKLPVQSSVYTLHNYNNRLYIGERSGMLTVYDFLEQKIVAQTQAHTKPIFDIISIKSKDELLTTGEDGTVAVWSLKDLEELYRFQISTSMVRTMAVSPDESEIAFGSKDHAIYVYNLADYSFKQSLQIHSGPVTSLAYHPNGKYLISGGRDAKLNVFNLPEYQLRETITAHMFGVYSIIFHPSLPYFATCSQDKSIKLWDAEDFKLYKILSLEKSGMGHSHSINKIMWSNDGKYLISTGDDRQVMVWEMEG
ncbi:WD40 repeat protein [Pedobacter sp. UYP30]|uniref:WD40 repeat domain-containing protein n=1 Tax=Pedobacter sp. UYP30 TaxID=1756400 RepID=UPI00339257AB